MKARIDGLAQHEVLSMTPLRHSELQQDLEQASEDMASALRRGGSPQRFKDLCLLMTALDAAREVLASTSATRR